MSKPVISLLFIAAMTLNRSSASAATDASGLSSAFTSISSLLKGDIATMRQRSAEDRLSRTAAISKAAMERKRVRVLINLTTQKMTVERPDGPPLIFSVSTGKDGYKTAIGYFDVEKYPSGYRVYKTYVSRKYDAPMPHAIFFHQGTATHSALGQWDCLGDRPCSHGCVRTSPEAAEQLYLLVKKHGPQNVGFRVYEERPQDERQGDI